MPDGQDVAVLRACIDELLRQGQWQGAEAACQELVRAAPHNADDWCRLGIVLLVQERCAEADGALGQAIGLAPGRADSWGNRSVARAKTGRYAEAEADARQAVALDGNSAVHWLNLGAVLSDRGKWPEAAGAYREAVARDPNNPVAWSSLGAAQQWLGNLNAAQDCHQKSLAIAPASTQGLTQYAYLLLRRGAIEQACELLRSSLERDPRSPQAWNAMGNAHLLLNRFSAAESAFRQAMALAPRYRLARRDYCRSLIRRGALTEAHELARQLAAEDPQSPDGWDLLGTSCLAEGRASEAIAAHARCLEVDPAPVRHSALLCALQYAEEATPSRLLDAHTDWHNRHTSGLAANQPPHRARAQRDPVLRLGFVSADFARHPTGCLVLPALEHLRDEACSVVCYSDRLAEDDCTTRFRAASSRWRVTSGLTDDELAQQIREDGIDILFDLMGHTGSRLLMFARKPAPIQVSWFGYVGTTGLTAIDFLLADAIHVRPDEDAYYRETVLRMPNAYACFTGAYDAPDVSSLPAFDRGFVTFGSFSNPAKFSPLIVNAWAEVLQQVPRSRLFLKYVGLDDSGVQSRIGQAFRERGVEPDRLVFEGRSPHPDLMASYNRVDLALDTQPYSGGLTTCEALWMGVPVITVPGQTFAGRHATSYLHHAGYPLFVAQDSEGYIELAVRWANRLDELAMIRSQMREQVRQSPLGDAARFARDFMALVRAAWESRAPSY